MNSRAIFQRKVVAIRLVLYLGSCLGLLLHSPRSAWADTSAPKKCVGSELRVMTFNIRYGTADDGENSWDKRQQLVYSVLRRHRPDVVGLQEALRFQIDQVRAAVPQYGEIGVGRDDGRTKGEYSAILYRVDRFGVDEAGTFWFSDTPNVPGSIHWGNACTRVCTWARFIDNNSDTAFYLYNVHLDHRSQPSREKSVHLLAERIHSRTRPDPVVITGDFNAGEDNPAIMYLKGKVAIRLSPAGGGQDDARVARAPVVFTDSFRQLHASADPAPARSAETSAARLPAAKVGTFNGFKGIRSGDKIDYVFVQPETQVLEAQIVRDSTDGRYPSDHFPVIARICLAKSQEMQNVKRKMQN